MNMLRKATPVVVVDRIEPALAFWKKLGVQPVTEVPDAAASDGRLGFVILATEGIELMYQTAASVRADLVKSASVADAFSGQPQQAVLYIEVPQLAQIEAALQGEQVIMPRRTTFYGATEAAYGDRAGNVIVFSEHTTAA